MNYSKGDIIEITCSTLFGGERTQLRVLEQTDRLTLTYCTELEYWRDHVKISLSREEMEKELKRLRESLKKEARPEDIYKCLCCFDSGFYYVRNDIGRMESKSCSCERGVRQ